MSVPGWWCCQRIRRAWKPKARSWFGRQRRSHVRLRQRCPRAARRCTSRYRRCIELDNRVPEADMSRKSDKWLALGGAAVVCVLALAPAAQAEDFFSALFGGFGGGRPHAVIRLPFGGEGNFLAPQNDPRPRVGYYPGGSQAYCVRACDGRYFPVSASDSQSRAASCNSFCPASETSVVYGSNIDNAAT